jgi:hypothetical protein
MKKSIEQEEREGPMRNRGVCLVPGTAVNACIRNLNVKRMEDT